MVQNVVEPSLHAMFATLLPVSRTFTVVAARVPQPMLNQPETPMACWGCSNLSHGLWRIISFFLLNPFPPSLLGHPPLNPKCACIPAHLTRHPGTNKRDNCCSAKMRQSRTNTCVFVRHTPINQPVHGQQGRHCRNSPQISSLQEYTREDAQCQVAAAHALYEASGESIILNGHAETCCHGGGRQEHDETGAEEEAGDAVVGEEFEV
jgi:hypothetical protein